MDLSAFLGEFRAEADEHLGILDTQLLHLEREPNTSDAIRSMFLSAHTIKGGASMLGLSDVAELAHALEDVLAYYRDGQKPLDRSTADLLFRTLDELRERVGASTPGGANPSALVGELGAALQRLTSPVGESEPPASQRRLVKPVRRRALIVHASATARLVQQLQLEAAGFEVDAVASAEEAESTAGPYAVIVVGELPSSPARRIASQPARGAANRSVPTILTVASAADGMSQSATEPGLRGCVQIGPLGDDGLAEAVHSACSRSNRRPAKSTRRDHHGTSRQAGQQKLTQEAS